MAAVMRRSEHGAGDGNPRPVGSADRSMDQFAARSSW